MINEIEIIQMPDWLSSVNFKFNINEVLKDSLYYPSSAFDGDPIKYFMGNVYSFIYVDYCKTRDDLINEIDNNGFNGYKVIHRQSISKYKLTPKGKSIYSPLSDNERPSYYYSHKEWKKISFCEWIIFERHEDKDKSYNPKRFSLLYMCNEGVATFQELYLSNDISPKIVCIIQPGHNFGNNWTDYTDRNKAFAKTVFLNSNVPEYLINGGNGQLESYLNPIWKEYKQKVWSIKAGWNCLVLWKYSGRNKLVNNSNTYN